ncbi:UvrD-helicase domain-containing protein [Neobacillus drentensis]|uniref:UvrD-helicase domain-containing protein n=1 Tax=Neobacillus drentensis TaxID=220684 RepID=UPI002866B34E|nr:UvrD-helicase domain-containing protein [Neobacillus drentensis]MDR7239834.1 DNA helicase-2/ATP-dependent DNA helicase PcrA [Neobacillus drentensis]
MKTAIYQNQNIFLEQLSRDQYQKIFLAGKNGQLNCSVCKENVRLFLGIQKEPHFYHMHSPDIHCPEPTVTVVKLDSHQSTEINGFHMPKGRTITTTPPSIDMFKTATSIESTVPYKQSMSNNHVERSSYLQQLAESGVILDESQAAAVMETEGSLLVLAGAGSGKTRVLTARTAFMMNEKHLDPRTIMLVTFTSKAAAEMKNRLLSYPHMKREKITQLVTGTFHSIFYRILMFHDGNNWSSNKLLKKEWQRDKILKESGKELNLSEKEFAYDLALQQIGLWKNSLLMPNEVKPASEWEEKVVFLYKRYEEYKNREGLFDFDDMLIGCYQLFVSTPSLLEQYQERFHYFLIDEFQDINKVQYELIKLLSGKHKNVCAVGDDDQAIYSFRGSDPSYLLEFEKDFPYAKIVTLDQNYRSSHEIVTAANQMIAANKVRRTKKMKAQFSSERLPQLFFPFDEEEEATMILTDIQGQISLGANPSDFAILYRTNAGSRAVFERLAGSNLPFKIDLDAEAFYERYIVRSALAFLKVSLNEEDPQAMADILPLLFLKQTLLKELKAQSILRDCSLLEALAHLTTAHAFQEKKLKKAVTIIRGLKHTSPQSAIEKVEKDIGFLDFLKKRGNESNKLEKGSDDLKDLKVAAKSFDSLEAFLAHAEHMSAMNREIKNLSKHFQDAISLSTIHRSKGLEYKTVYIIGAVDGSLPHDFALEAYRNGDFNALEEERRLFYVAMTRAKEQLFISVPQNRRGKKANRSRFIAPLNKKKKTNS